MHSRHTRPSRLRPATQELVATLHRLRDSLAQGVWSARTAICDRAMPALVAEWVVRGPHTPTTATPSRDRGRDGRHSRLHPMLLSALGGFRRTPSGWRAHLAFARPGWLRIAQAMPWSSQAVRPRLSSFDYAPRALAKGVRFVVVGLSSLAGGGRAPQTHWLERTRAPEHGRPRPSWLAGRIPVNVNRSRIDRCLSALRRKRKSHDCPP